MRDAIRRGTAENEVQKHEEKLTGVWRQMSTLRRRYEKWCKGDDKEDCTHKQRYEESYQSMVKVLQQNTWIDDTRNLHLYTYLYMYTRSYGVYKSYMCIYIYICIHIHTCIHVLMGYTNHICVYISTFAYISIRVYTFLWGIHIIYVYIYLDLCMHIYTYQPKHIKKCMHIYNCIRVHLVYNIYRYISIE